MTLKRFTSYYKHNTHNLGSLNLKKKRFLKREGEMNTSVYREERESKTIKHDREKLATMDAGRT
jgi:hypothetical protein